MAVVEEDRGWGFNRAILPPSVTINHYPPFFLAFSFSRPHCFGTKGETYPTNHPPTPPTPPHQIPRALPHLALFPPIFFEEIPIRGPRPVAQCMLLRQRYGVVGASQCAADELGAEGEEVRADLAAG